MTKGILIIEAITKKYLETLYNFRHLCIKVTLFLGHLHHNPKMKKKKTKTHMVDKMCAHTLKEVWN
jgi:hypothetical protein